MSDNENPQETIFPKETIKLIKELKSVYEHSQIPDVLQEIKDNYCSTTEDDTDKRAGFITVINDVINVFKGLIPKKIIPIEDPNL